MVPVDYFNARNFTGVLGRFNSPDPGNIGASLYNPQTWNGYSYVANNPLNSADPSGACDVVIGGFTQTPNAAGTAQQQAFAQSIGAISVFPYANGSFGQGVAAVAEQSTNAVTPETQAVMNALSAAAAEGTPVNVFAFSGGAQALTTAINNLPWSVTSEINNISYVSPGALQDLALSPTGGDTALVRSTGIRDLAVIGSVSPLVRPSNIFTTSCGFLGHSADCEFRAAASFLRAFSGTPCSSTTGTFANYQSHSPTRGTATSTITYGSGGGASGFSGGWVFEPMFGEEGNVIGGGWVLFPSPGRQQLLPY